MRACYVLSSNYCHITWVHVACCLEVKQHIVNEWLNDVLVFAVDSDMQLTGSEDINILHAYIAYLPSKLAYVEGERRDVYHVLYTNTRQLLILLM